jgi:hypothetical protein
MSVFNEEYQFDSNYRIFTNLHRPRTIISSVVESGRSATSLVLLSKCPVGGGITEDIRTPLSVWMCSSTITTFKQLQTI